MPPFASNISLTSNIVGLHGCGGCAPCFCDFFTCSLWTITGSGYVIDCSVDFEVDWDNSGAGSFCGHGIAIDMICTTVSDTAWVWRQKHEITCHTGTGNNQTYSGISSVTSTGRDTVQDNLGFRAVKATLNGWFNFFGNGVALSASSSSGVNITATAACQTIFWEMKRLTATTFSVQPFSCACFCMTVACACTDTISCGIVCLRHAKMSNMFFSCTAQFKGHMDNVEFWDGITCVP